MNTTDQGVQFIERHEGFVSRAYRDQGGVVTIGTGFTMGSAVFGEYWRKKHGRPLAMGDTITQQESRQVFASLLADEYEPPVNRKLVAVAGGLKPHEFDVGVSTCYNAGPAILEDRWAVALVTGDVDQAANLLQTTRITARGKPSRGLRNRRADEAVLLRTGNYGTSVHTSKSVSREAVMAYQNQLITLGYDLGDAGADGVAGSKTHAAVREFQTKHGLVVDGIVGPATRATLERAVSRKRATRGIGTAAAGGGAIVGGSTAAEQSASVEVLSSAGWLLLIVAIGALLGWLAWRYRGAIALKLKSIF